MQLYDEEIESASLGSIFLNKEALYDIIETLSPGDFYNDKNQIVFKTVKNLFENNIGIDELIVEKEINKNGLKIPKGYIYELIASVPCMGENYKHYNNIIKIKSYQRNMYKILEDIKNDKIGLEEGISQVESLPREDVKEEAFSSILEHTLKDSIHGVKYKFQIDTLNHYLGGVDNGELVTIGGYTSQGKSTFAIQLAIDFAANNKKVLYLSTEMSEQEIGRRILSNQNKKNIMDFRKGRFEEGEKEAFQSIINIISKISGKWEMNIKRVYDILDIKKYIRKYKPEVVFLDYIQNLGADSKFSDYQRATYNIKELQKLALEKDIVIFVLSQLSRNKEIRKPRLADLRDSGRIEECSNIVIFLYWEDRLKEKIKQRRGGEPPEELEIRIGKNRDGTIGKMCLDFYPEYCRIEDKEQKHDDQRY